MEAYIDISYIFHLFLSFSTMKFVKMLSNIVLDKKKQIIIYITSIILYLNVLLFKECIYPNIFYYIIIFFFIFKKNFIKPLFIYLFAYYSQISIIRLFTYKIFLYKGIVMIYIPSGFFYVFLLPLLFVIIWLIAKSVKSLIFLKKYRYNVTVMINEKVYKLSAYFDSGNTMKFNDIPVIFLTEEFKERNIKYNKLLIKGVGEENGEYLKGTILFENRVKEVYCAYLNKRSFNGCKCLLNVYLLG